jgi:dihydroorotate dehydrogenase
LNSLSLLKLKFINTAASRYFSQSPSGELNRFGLCFSNPVGVAAGFDKDGIALEGLAALGFSFIEAGTVTLHPQPGNERPRLFRLPDDKALINRAGFNNEGAAAIASRVKRRKPDCVLGVSIGKSKITPFENARDDYLASFDLVYPVADYIAVNVSSPNTEKLRDLQRSDQLTSLLATLQNRNRELQEKYNRTKPMPLLVKLSPDLGYNELEVIVDVVRRQTIDGIIATNTTVSRTNLRTGPEKVAAIGSGGLSGLPLKSIATSMVATLYQLTEGRIPLIGVGGIFNAADAWEKITAGASLIQLYTGLIYQGPSIAREINQGIKLILAREGFKHLDQAIGCRANELGKRGVSSMSG